MGLLLEQQLWGDIEAKGAGQGHHGEPRLPSVRAWPT